MSTPYITKMVSRSRPKPEAVITSARNKISARFLRCHISTQLNSINLYYSNWCDSSCTAMPDYEQRPKSQHGITNVKYSFAIYIWFLDVGLQTFGSNVGFGAPENTFIAVRMPKKPCSIPNLLPFLVYGVIQYGNRKLGTLITSVMNNITWFVKFYWWYACFQGAPYRHKPVFNIFNSPELVANKQIITNTREKKEKQYAK